MKFIKVIGFFFIVLFVSITVLHFVAPKNTTFERSIHIPVSQKEIIYRNISDLNEYKDWNPWLAKDPNQKIKIKGEMGKLKSKYSWNGNKLVGKGSMLLLAKDEYEFVDYRYRSEKPYDLVCQITFTMTPEEDGYQVKWKYYNNSNFPYHIIHYFTHPFDGLEDDLQKGLENLRSKCIKDGHQFMQEEQKKDMEFYKDENNADTLSGEVADSLGLN